MKYDLALIGLGVMGQSLARNFANHKIHTLVFNRTTAKAETFIKTHGNSYLDYRIDFGSLLNDLKSPRVIVLMVQAGPAVDEMAEQLRPHLRPNDILIDAGNSYYKDTQRRVRVWKEQSIHWVGMGVSGGEEGALKGPSIMPGCEPKVWTKIAPFLKKIAARDFKGKPCVTHVGTDGAGHFVKMVHNGIEYGIMQMMAEAYHMLKTIYGLSAPQIADIFEKYNADKLQSYLFEIAVPVLRRSDEFKKGHLIDHILDRAGQKGTGRWVAIDALDHGLVLPTITEAVYARTLSSFKAERVKLATLFPSRKSKSSLPLRRFVRELEAALYASILSNYAQGFEQIRAMAEVNHWKIDFAEVARIWEGGCIIRAELLNFLHQAFKSARGKAVHLFTIKEVQKALKQNLSSWREVVAYGMQHGIPLPTLVSSLSYFESMTRAELPANFIQGLRDYFGAHTYERTDRPGIFHTQWLSD